MADDSTRHTEPAAETSIWLWLFRPIAIALTSLGLVMLVAGITSVSINGIHNGSYILLTPAGSFILSFGVLLGIGVIIRMREEKKMLAKAQRSDNEVLDLTTEFTTVEISVDSASYVETPGDGEQWNPQESTLTAPPRYEDVVLSHHIVVLPDVSPDVACEEVMVALEDPNQFESPPSYEEATSGVNDV